MADLEVNLSRFEAAPLITFAACMDAFVGVGIRQIYLGIIPFVLFQRAVLGLVLAWPNLALWLPHRLPG